VKLLHSAVHPLQSSGLVFDHPVTGWVGDKSHMYREATCSYWFYGPHTVF